jgi:hypothetical protein
MFSYSTVMLPLVPMFLHQLATAGRCRLQRPATRPRRLAPEGSTTGTHGGGEIRAAPAGAQYRPVS